MSLSACPLCHMDQAQLLPLEAFLLGVGIRRALDDDKPIASQMCDAHRPKVVFGMLTLAQKMAGIDHAPPTLIEPAPGATTDGAAADACVGAILGGGR